MNYEAASSSYSSSAQSNNTATATRAIKWKTGDRCLAPWNEDGKYERKKYELYKFDILFF